MILRFKKVNLRNLLIYIEAFLIIQQSGSVQAAILPDGISYKICRLALLGLTSYFVAISINKKINIREKYHFYVLILFTIPIIINLLIYSPGFGKAAPQIPNSGSNGGQSWEGGRPGPQSQKCPIPPPRL